MSAEHKKPLPEELIVEIIDLSEGWNKASMRDILIKRMEELGIYQPNLLFRGFNGRKIKTVKRHGTDTPKATFTFCSDQIQFLNPFEIDQSAFDFALGYKTPGLAVYDGDQLVKGDEYDPDYEYVPKEGSSFRKALLAVFILK